MIPYENLLARLLKPKLGEEEAILVARLYTYGITPKDIAYCATLPSTHLTSIVAGGNVNALEDLNEFFREEVEYALEEWPR